MGDKSIHWAVTMNHRNRSLSFAMVFVVAATYLHHVGAGPWQWGLVAAFFLVYPQLAYWRAVSVASPLRAEMHNLVFDDFVFGIGCMYWGLPLWPSFILFICACLNLVVFEGFTGLAKAMLALAAGVGVAALIGPVQFRPDTPLLTSLLCVATLSLYLLAFAFDAYKRGIALHESGRRLRVQLAEITALQARLREQASRDPLTGLYNRRHLNQELAEELAHCQRSGKSLALVMADIDHFKAINDAHGHLAGDEVIRRLAELLAQRVGEAGMACRFGGEEFLLMLPGMTTAEACRFADGIRDEFEGMRIAIGADSIAATLSFGVAVAPEHSIDAQTLLRKADAALYEAKLRGRNRVMLTA